MLSLWEFGLLLVVASCSLNSFNVVENFDNIVSISLLDKGLDIPLKVEVLAQMVEDPPSKIFDLIHL